MNDARVESRALPPRALRGRERRRPSMAALWLGSGLVAALALSGCDSNRYGLANEGTPEPGVVTAAQPSAEQIRALADEGFQTVVNLRTDEEMAEEFDERELVESLGMRYVTLPVADAEDVSFENAQRLDEILAAREGPVLVHCASSNRVGALFALRARLVENADPEQALRRGEAAGLTTLEPRVRELLEADGR